MRRLLGEGAPLSASPIARLRARWQLEYEAWSRRSLVDREVVYAWADGIYVKAGLEKEKPALLVVVALSGVAPLRAGELTLRQRKAHDPS